MRRPAAAFPLYARMSALPRRCRRPDTLLKHAERRYGISLQPDALELVGAEWPLPKLGTYALHLNVPEGYTIQQQVVLRAPEFNMDLVADVEETGEEEDE